MTNEQQPQAPEDTSSVSTPSLQTNDRCKVKYLRNENHQELDAIILERRPIRKRRRKEYSATTTSSSANNSNREDDTRVHPFEYYVHYIDHDRRLDEWISLNRIRMDSIVPASESAVNLLAETETSPHGTSKTAAPPKTTIASTTTNTTTPTNKAAVTKVPLNGEAPTASGAQRRRSSMSVSSSGSSARKKENTTAEQLLSGGNWHRSSSNNTDPVVRQFEKEHEATTRVKNIERIIMGLWEVESWYYSPFPDQYSGLDTLYVCEYCLTYMKSSQRYKEHRATCPHRTPPGLEIYHEDDLRVYELDGKEHRAYCQKLCLLAKLFLDHKTLYYDVTPFLFYVVARVDSEGAHIVGYFSKEKHSELGYNLACILTFPQYQKSGYGKFIISLSYEITKREGKTGSPEKPLSDLGKVSYRSYWTYVILTTLASIDLNNSHNISIDSIAEQTGIRNEDLLSTLQSLGMIKTWKGQFVVYVHQSTLQEQLDKIKAIRLCKPEYLTWSPPSSRKENNKVSASNATAE